jgi:hypothetical protein
MNLSAKIDAHQSDCIQTLLHKRHDYPFSGCRIFSVPLSAETKFLPGKNFTSFHRTIRLFFLWFTSCLVSHIGQTALKAKKIEPNEFTNLKTNKRRRPIRSFPAQQFPENGLSDCILSWTTAVPVPAFFFCGQNFDKRRCYLFSTLLNLLFFVDLISEKNHPFFAACGDQHELLQKKWRQ